MSRRGGQVIEIHGLNRYQTAKLVYFPGISWVFLHFKINIYIALDTFT
jgi:hypothetical protein